METDHIKLSTLATATAAVAALEFLAGFAVSAALAPAMVCTGLARAAAVAVLLAIIRKMQGGLDAIGLKPSGVGHGLIRGGIWSLGFGMPAALGLAVCYLAGLDSAEFLHVPLPRRPIDMAGYFVLGAGLAPVAEEIYFRGVIYGYFRRWGAAAAVAGSTLLFVAVHPGLNKIPITQIAGGLLFATSYEIEKNLVVPIVIHIAGNLALFTLSLII